MKHSWTARAVGIIAMSLIVLTIAIFQTSYNQMDQEISYEHYKYLLRAKEVLNDKELDTVIHNAKEDRISYREYYNICNTIDNIMIKEVLDDL